MVAASGKMQLNMSNRSNSDLTPVVPRKVRPAFFMLVACFALWGLLNNMTDNLVPAFQRIFTMDQSRAGLVQVAFYGAYAVLAIFASILIEEFSYRIGLLIGLGIYVLGALLYIPACVAQDFEIYFIAIFVVAGGCSLMETTCNPFVLSLGDKKTAVRRLNFAQAFNPVGSITGIALASGLILANLNPATAEERRTMDPEQLRSIIHSELFWVCAPYVGLCAIALLIWCFFLRYKGEAREETVGSEKSVGSRLSRVFIALLFAALPLWIMLEIWPDMDKVTWVLCGMIGPFVYLLMMKDYRSMLFTLLRKPRYTCGVVAQFFYVGVQIAAWTWLNAYCQRELGVDPATASHYYLASIVMFIICRWTATYYMKKFNPAGMMALFAVAAIITCAGVMYLPSSVLFTIGGHPVTPNVIALVLMSGCMSLMFPTIYGIALGGLGNEVKLGAAGLIMAILGGAVITPWMASIISSGDYNCLVSGFSTEIDTTLKCSSASLRASFIVPAICFAVVLVYALIFRKPLEEK